VLVANSPDEVEVLPVIGNKEFRLDSGFKEARCEMKTVMLPET